MIESQIALNSNLSNYFVHIKEGSLADHNFEDLFESYKVIVLDGFKISNLEFFASLPKTSFDEWIPPVFQKELNVKINESHPLWKFYPNRDVILAFQQESALLIEQVESLIREKMSSYEFSSISCSWRMNAMDKGLLHFDVPEESYENHQVRYFINLSARPRIIEFGPTLEEFLSHHRNHPKLKEWLQLSHHEFHSRLKYDLIKPSGYEDSILPRHYLSLAPGSIWIGNAFSVLHGLVFGEKTVCLEGKIKPQSLNKPEESSFESKMKRLRELYG